MNNKLIPYIMYRNNYDDVKKDGLFLKNIKKYNLNNDLYYIAIVNNYEAA